MEMLAAISGVSKSVSHETKVNIPAFMELTFTHNRQGLSQGSGQTSAEMTCLSAVCLDCLCPLHLLALFFVLKLFFSL